MIIFYNNQLSIEFNESIFNKLNSFKQSPVTSSESGGVLMGKRLLNGNISITNITTPQPKDISSRYFFKKNKKIHQKLSDDIWKSSNGRIINIGEWHTHPEAIPHPSVLDLIGWKLHVKKQDDERTYIFLIIGIEEIGIWSYSKERGLKKFLNKVY